MEDENCFCQAIEFWKKQDLRWINDNSKAVIDRNELKHIAHIGSCFDSWSILKNLPTWWILNKPNKTTRVLITVKSSENFSDVKKSYEAKPQNINSLSSMNHPKGSLTILGITFGLQEDLL